MEFSLICPNDGRVEVGLESISAVVFRGPDTVDVVLMCPECGETLRASLHVPNILMTAMEFAKYLEDLSPESGEETGFSDADATTAAMDHHADAYCEYFRRQLSQIECVEDLLTEIEPE